MSKYDFELDMSLNTSTGLILNKIKRGSRVLEFGCAEGRMTRYMKEELSCDVYICEYNREAFEKALTYAVDGVCGDILDYEWRSKFAGLSFNYILFADVLEHLANPLEVLKKASEMLAPDGEVIASVPNVTHNDIILKATQERFDYMPTGLLDDTHIHFWGKENLKPFVESAGLCLKRMEGTYFETGFSEQLYGTSLAKYSPSLLNSLKERECGEVYQYVITCVKPEAGSFGSTNAGDCEEIFKPSRVKSALYYDRGEGYSEENRDYISSSRIGEGLFRAEIKIENPGGLREIRFDPVDNQYCIITKAVAKQGDRNLEIRYPRCIFRDFGALVYGDDPMIMIAIQDDTTPLELEAEFIVMGDRYQKILSELVFEFFDQINR